MRQCNDRFLAVLSRLSVFNLMSRGFGPTDGAASVVGNHAVNRIPSLALNF